MKKKSIITTNFEVNQKSITSDQFTSLLNQIKSGKFECEDSTYAEDEEIVHFVKIRRGSARYFTYSKLKDIKNETYLHKKSGEDQAK